MLEYKLCSLLTAGGDKVGIQNKAWIKETGQKLCILTSPPSVFSLDCQAVCQTQPKHRKLITNDGWFGPIFCPILFRTRGVAASHVATVNNHDSSNISCPGIANSKSQVSARSPDGSTLNLIAFSSSAHAQANQALNKLKRNTTSWTINTRETEWIDERHDIEAMFWMIHEVTEASGNSKRSIMSSFHFQCANCSKEHPITEWEMGNPSKAIKPYLTVFLGITSTRFL